ncbi:MAG: purine-binding chemotaxis protein CheW [Hymenobacteraceae bacterium]|nr:purine-binding chemotaxis protein CheW [Hymenobacteraceae bacterium]
MPRNSKATPQDATLTPSRAAEVAPADLLQPIIRRTQTQIEPMMQLIVFPLGREEYAIRIGQVKEITVTPEIARMPRTPPFLRGVANIRGELIAVIDLEERFQMTRAADVANAAADPRTYTLVVEAADYAIGLLVSAMPLATTVPVALLERAPDFLQTLPSIHDKYVEGFIRLPDSDRVIILLDLLRLLRPEEILQLPDPAAVSKPIGVARRK